MCIFKFFDRSMHSKKTQQKQMKNLHKCDKYQFDDAARS